MKSNLNAWSVDVRMRNYKEQQVGHSQVLLDMHSTARPIAVNMRTGGGREVCLIEIYFSSP